jgi:hypothetical protein
VPVAGEHSTRRESCERAACNRGVNLRVNKRGAAELSIKSIKVPCAVDDVRGELLTRSMEVNPGLADAEKTCRMQAARNSFSFLASPAFGSRSHFLGATSVLHLTSSASPSSLLWPSSAVYLVHRSGCSRRQDNGHNSPCDKTIIRTNSVSEGGHRLLRSISTPSQPCPTLSPVQAGLQCLNHRLSSSS